MEEWYKKILSYKEYPEGTSEKREYDWITLTQKEFALKYYKNYSEGTNNRKTYDKYTLPLNQYILKYYKNCKLSRWEEKLNKFVYPLFDESKRKQYYDFLYQAKPPFYPEIDKLEEFWLKIKDDQRFDDELKHFFTFLYSCNFYKNMPFEEWLVAKNWLHPWHNDYKDEDEGYILEILKYPYGNNFIKVLLADMPWFQNY